MVQLIKVFEMFLIIIPIIVIIFIVVNIQNSKDFHEQMLDNNNQCELIIFPNAPHSPSSSTLGDQGKLLNYYHKYC